MSATEESRRAIMHVKCRVIQRYNDAVREERDRDETNDETGFGITIGASMHRTILMLVVGFFVGFILLNNLVQYSCQMYGGSKCNGKSLLPSWFSSGNHDSTEWITVY